MDKIIKVTNKNIFTLSEVLGEDFVFIKEENLSAIHLVIFAHKSISNDVSGIYNYLKIILLYSNELK